MSYIWPKLSKISSSFLSGVVLGLPIYITVNDYLFSIARVEGASMQPTLNPRDKKQSDFVFIDRWHVMPKDIHPGDIIALTSPNNQNVSFIKRVVGIEGDFLNTPRYKHNYVIIPKGHCWVEGDNNRSSLDSNKLGPISLGLVKGKATHIVWPPHRWSKLNQDIPENAPTEKIVFPNKLKTSDMDAQQKMGVSVHIDSLGDTEDNSVSYDVEFLVTEKTEIAEQIKESDINS